MRNKKSTYILIGMIAVPLLLTLYICGKQIITATEQHVERQNARYAEIEKALGR